jgi:hypothetical protein
MNAPFNPSNIPLQEERLEVAAAFPLRFWTEYHDVDTAKPGEPEKLERRASEWVKWAKKGVPIPTNTDIRIKHAQKDKPLWAAIKPYYDNWKAGGSDELIQGTPLNAWGGVLREEVEALKPYRIYSVEDFAAMSDDVMQRIPFPAIASKRDRAKKWLTSKETSDEVRSQLSDVLAKLKEAEEKVALLETKDSAAKKLAEMDKPKAKKVKEEAVS